MKFSGGGGQINRSGYGQNQLMSIEKRSFEKGKVTEYKEM